MEESGKCEENEPLERPEYRWEDNIKINFKGIRYGGINYINLTQDSVQWQAFVNTVLHCFTIVSVCTIRGTDIPYGFTFTTLMGPSSGT
jgi:hypothetical protein